MAFVVDLAQQTRCGQTDLGKGRISSRKRQRHKAKMQSQQGLNQLEKVTVVILFIGRI